MVNNSGAPELAKIVNNSGTPELAKIVKNSGTPKMTETVNNSTTPELTKKINNSGTLKMIKTFQQFQFNNSTSLFPDILPRLLCPAPSSSLLPAPMAPAPLSIPISPLNGPPLSDSPSSPSPLVSASPPPILSSPPSQVFPPLPLASRVSSSSVAGSGSGVAGSSGSACCPVVSGGVNRLMESRADSFSKSTPSSPSMAEEASLKQSVLPGALGELSGGGPGGYSCSSGDVVAHAAGASSASLGPATVPSWASIVNKSSMGSGNPLKFFPPAFSDPVMELFPPVEVTQQGDATWKDSLLGYFIEAPLNFHVVNHIARKMWAKFGLGRVAELENGFFLFRFNSEALM